MESKQRIWKELPKKRQKWYMKFSTWSSSKTPWLPYHRKALWSRWCTKEVVRQNQKITVRSVASHDFTSFPQYDIQQSLRQAQPIPMPWPGRIRKTNPRFMTFKLNCTQKQKMVNWPVDGDDRLPDDVRLNTTWCNLEPSQKPLDRWAIHLCVSKIVCWPTRHRTDRRGEWWIQDRSWNKAGWSFEQSSVQVGSSISNGERQGDFACPTCVWLTTCSWWRPLWSSSTHGHIHWSRSHRDAAQDPLCLDRVRQTSTRTDIKVLPTTKSVAPVGRCCHTDNDVWCWDVAHNTWIREKCIARPNAECFRRVIQAKRKDKKTNKEDADGKDIHDEKVRKKKIAQIWPRL